MNLILPWITDYILTILVGCLFGEKKANKSMKWYVYLKLVPSDDSALLYYNYTNRHFNDHPLTVEHKCSRSIKEYPL